MTDCESMTDKMALVAHGRDSWTDEELAHLRTCTVCGAEWPVVQAASRLGSAQARRVEPDRVARKVLAGLEAGRRWRRATWVAMAAAAALAILVWTQLPTGRQPELAVSAPGFRLPLAELDDLDTRQLRAVLDDMDGPFGASASPDVPGLGDLEQQELERVLRSLEG